MNSFENLIINRRSTRKYQDKPLSGDMVKLLLQAGLMAPTSKNRKPCHFIVVEDKNKLSELSLCKRGGCKFIADAPIAIIIGADPQVSDVWIEDAAIAATYIQLQAEALGLGSCWVQIRDRQTATGYDSDGYIREVINAPMPLQILAIITIGYKDENKQANNPENLLWENVHIDNF